MSRKEYYCSNCNRHIEYYPMRIIQYFKCKGAYQQYKPVKQLDLCVTCFNIYEKAILKALEEGKGSK